ncbi:MAG: hypothetical protein KA314_19755 [Chloroflexi bacterium]|nr:hypothetical protein [Chloroflexota bacterium]MBP8058071.1 hypothetical protein [Chloroflexota bacterium]
MLEDLMKILVGGQQTEGQEEAHNPLGDLLKVVLGGQQGQGTEEVGTEAPSAGASSGGLADILQVILGNQGQTPATEDDENQPASASATANPLVNSIARLLAEKLNIAPEVAQVVVTLALTLVMAKLQATAGTDKTVAVPSQQAIRQSGAARQLAAQTGMNQKDAAATLQKAVAIITGQPTPASRAARGLKGNKGAKSDKPRKPRPTTNEPPPTTAAGRGRIKPRRL